MTSAPAGTPTSLPSHPPESRPLTSDCSRAGRCPSTARSTPSRSSPTARCCVVTETNHVYTLDPVTGAILHQRVLENAWAADELGCQDLAPSVGITGTPVIDTRDPSNVTAYFVTKGYVSGTSGPVGAWMHAVDIPTLTERPNFPVRIQGQADNNGAVTFDGKYELQRPGLLMLGDTVYAAFAGHCDIEPFQGLDRRCVLRRGAHRILDRDQRALFRQRHLAERRGSDVRRAGHLHRGHRQRAPWSPTRPRARAHPPFSARRGSGSRSRGTGSSSRPTSSPRTMPPR